MKCVVQVASAATLAIVGHADQTIGPGMVVFVGFTHTDTMAVIDGMITKLLDLRIFPDSDGKTNVSLKDMNGQMLCVPNFTLYAEAEKSRRPSFIKAAKPEEAKGLFAYFQQRMKVLFPPCQFGVFGANMSVVVHNDGPFTLILKRDA